MLFHEEVSARLNFLVANSKYLEIGDRIMQGANVEHWHLCSPDRCCARGGEIWCVRPNTLWNLYLFAHECGHVALHRGKTGLRLHVTEYQAEFYAHAAFVQQGLTVPDWITEQQARWNVARYVNADIRRGRIDYDRASFEFAYPFLRRNAKQLHSAGKLSFTEDSQPLLEHVTGEFLRHSSQAFHLHR